MVPNIQCFKRWALHLCPLHIFKILYGLFYIKVSCYITSHDTQKNIEIVGFKIVLKYILLHDLCP